MTVTKTRMKKGLWEYRRGGEIVSITTENLPEEKSVVPAPSPYKRWNWRKMRGLDPGKYARKEV